MSDENGRKDFYYHARVPSVSINSLFYVGFISIHFFYMIIYWINFINRMYKSVTKFEDNINKSEL